MSADLGEILKVINKFKEVGEATGNEEVFKREMDRRKIYNKNKIEADYKNVCDLNRNVVLSIVGAVKSGKSSMLNSLFFEGKNILPKAATPMTAALTTLSYGEKLKVRVNFFTKDDIEKLKKGSDEFDKLVSDVLRKVEENENNKEDTEKYNTKRKQKKIEKEIKNSNPRLNSSKEQYDLIKERGLEKFNKEYEDININEISEISSKLKDYVGADGKYTPVVSSVDIEIPDEKFKDLKIVDTPGINDPVVSRSEKTEKYLSESDSIFFVSQTGSFMSAIDINLISQIYIDEKIEDIYVIASQVDNELYASEKKDSISNFIESITYKLNDKLRDVIKGNSNIIFNSMKNLGADRVIVSSTMAQSLIYQLEQVEQGNLDNLDEKEGEGFYWKKFKESYPYDFSDEDKKTSLQALNQLANFDKINERLDSIRERKKEILEKKKKEFINVRNIKLNTLKKDLIEKFEGDRIKLEEKDKESILKGIKEIETMTRDIPNEITDMWRMFSLDFKNKFSDIFYKEIEEKYKSFELLLDDGEVIVENKVETGWFNRIKNSWNEYSFNYSKIKSEFKNCIDWFNWKGRKFSKNKIEDNFEKSLLNYAADCIKVLPVGYDTKFNLKRDMMNILYDNSIKLIKFSFKIDERPEWYRIDYSFMVKNDLGEQYTSQVLESARNLKNGQEDLFYKEFKENYIDKLLSINMGDELLKSHKKELEDLKEKLNNKDKEIEKYNRLLDKIREIKL